jgi:hypothetical protein
MRGLSLIAMFALFAVALPAVAEENNVPRDPIQAEQEKRREGHGFEQKMRQNPQLYPFPPKEPGDARAPRREPRPAPEPSRPAGVVPPGHVGPNG